MKKPTDLPSNRKYILTFIEGDAICSYYPTLSDILDTSGGRDFEWKFAIMEDFDKLLDLAKGGSLRMNFNRDNEDSFGIIKRTI